MYQLPSDIMESLKRQYPDVPMESLVHSIFDSVFRKSARDGACSIKSFGKFIMFSTYSTRLKKNVVRFKFNRSVSLDKQIKNDEYLLNILPCKTKVPFEDNNAEKCHTDTCLLLKEENLRTQADAVRNSKDVTNNISMKDVIEEIKNNKSTK
jgi:hypothetical protein